MSTIYLGIADTLPVRFTAAAGRPGKEWSPLPVLLERLEYFSANS